MNYFPTQPYEMFLRGFDTLEIAKTLQISEALALRLVNEARCATRGLQYPYPPYQIPARKPKILRPVAYAGKDDSEQPFEDKKLHRGSPIVEHRDTGPGIGFGVPDIEYGTGGISEEEPDIDDLLKELVVKEDEEA